MIRIALVTAIAAYAQDDDLSPLATAFAEAGISADIVAWDDPTVSWPRFDAVLLRSTWDYTMRLAEFLAWCERVAQLTLLLNPLPVVRWNTDKRYLGDLAQRGVPVIKSHFLAPADLGEDGGIAQFPQLSEFVVKPTVGAGSRDAQRYVQAEREAAFAHARRLLTAGRHVLVQPYLHAVDEEGETALIYFEGRFSHAIRKAPLLRRGEAPTRALFAAENIQACQPSSLERRIADRILAALPFDALPYARVDLLPSPEGPQLLELELTEPSLFFACAPEAVPRLVEAVLARVAGCGRRK